MIGNSGCIGANNNDAQQLDDAFDVESAAAEIAKTVGEPVREKNAQDAFSSDDIWRLYNLYAVMRERLQMLTWIVTLSLLVLVLSKR